MAYSLVVWGSTICFCNMKGQKRNDLNTWTSTAHVFAAVSACMDENQLVALFSMCLLYDKL